MKKIAIDLDGVLVDFNQAASNVIKQIFPRFYDRDDLIVPNRWNWSDVLSLEEFKEMWKEINATPTFWEDAPPYWDNILLTQSVLHWNPNVQIFYITSRKATKDHSAEEQTLHWLKDHSLIREHQTTLIVVPNSTRKVEIIRALEIKGIIDDHPTTIDMCRRYSKAYILERPWNIGAVSELEIDSVKTLGDYFDIMEVKHS